MSSLDDPGPRTMTVREPTAAFDARFSDPASEPTPWPETARALKEAELYWITTVRADGRPHVTPLIGVVVDGSLHFCTGLREQKARNLEHSDRIAMTTGTNTWAAAVFRVEPAKVIAFAKAPHGQTTYRF